jgi:putative flavoprotein involved in K+ transport
VRSVETAVVGAGQAGLVVSSLLSQAGREHVLLDRRSTLGGGWQDRWDAFRLVSPNWTTSMPGFPYRGANPDGFMPRDEIVDHFRAYAAAINAPVELGTDVTSLSQAADDGARGGGARAGGPRFRLETSRGTIVARDVIVAGGPFGRPHVPAIAGSLDPSIHSLHLNDYRNAGALPPGGVLLVGSGQSGVQLAEELMAAGREVTMAVGRCGRFPRTYRGRDIFWWLRSLATRGAALGTPLPAPGNLASSRLRLACNPQLSGHGERHDTNLRAMARAGLRLTGRLEAIEGASARFAADLAATLAFADAFFDDRFRRLFDSFAERAGERLPDDEPEQVAYDPPSIAELDLARELIGTVIWTSGFRPSTDWIRLPVFDEDGLPVTRRGRTDLPGLSFIGTPWLVDMGSANLVALVRDAEALAADW